ncbi:MAG: magnesium transporter [Methanolinea sp. SDB]|nr:MAG: magnesium transporter [Methanolinea sp. SDB]
MQKEAIQECLNSRDYVRLRELVSKLAPEDLLDLFVSLEKPDFLLVFRLLDRAKALEFFEGLDPDQQARIVAMSGDPEALALISSLDPDDRARLFPELPAGITNRLIRALKPEERDLLNLLLGYPEDSSGRIMSPLYLSVREDEFAGDVLSRLHATPLRPDQMEMMYVRTPARIFRGFVRLGSLIKAVPHTTMGELAEEPDLFVYTSDPREKAAGLIMERDIPAIPVLDSEQRLVGSITFDDIMDVVEEEVTEDFHKMATIRELKTNIREAGVSLLYRKRIPWLLALVFVNILTGAGMELYKSTITAAITLVFFLPLLIDSGGNTGSQSATLVIRSMAVGDVRAKDWLSLLGKELVVALALGGTMGLAVAALGLYRGGPEIAFIVALSMVSIVIMGALIGLSLPFILTRLKLDPATASGPLITSMADITGVLIYFSIAAILLGP